MCPITFELKEDFFVLEKKHSLQLLKNHQFLHNNKSRQ